MPLPKVKRELAMMEIANSLSFLNLKQIYPFTAPSAIPFTMFFTMQKYRRTMGTAINTLPAANRVNAV